MGSPNESCEEIGGKVIVRTGRRIPGVVPLGGVHSPISVVRMAVGDAYGAKEEARYWRRRGCLRTSIELGSRSGRVLLPPGRAHGREVFGGPKHGEPDLQEC